jgi:putative NADH-flavin reductase
MRPAWSLPVSSALFAPGQRTGTYRLGIDQLLKGADGTSRISMEDYAIAMVDELESPKHARQGFTVGY